MVIKQLKNHTNYEEYITDNEDVFRKLCSDKALMWNFSAKTKVRYDETHFIYIVAFQNKPFSEKWIAEMTSMSKYMEIEKCIK